MYYIKNREVSIVKKIEKIRKTFFQKKAHLFDETVRLVGTWGNLNVSGG